MAWRWIPPETWATSEKVSAFKLLRNARDNVRSLYSPPQCRTAGQGNQQLTAATLQMLTFPATVFDNDGMHGGTVGTQNEPERGLISPQTPGKYLARTSVDFQWSVAGVNYVWLGVRTDPTQGWFNYAADTSGPINSGGPHTVVTVEQAYIAAAGYQFAVIGYGETGGSEEVIAEYNMPLFYLHWLGGP